MSSQTQPKPWTRYVTGHDDSGKSTFVFEGDIPYEPAVLPDGTVAAYMGVPWEEAGAPDNNSKADTQRSGPAIIPLTNESGSLARIVVMTPGTSSPMHRTNSIDYDVVIEGEIELELEDGNVRVVKKGDIIVQRGTTDKPARLLAVMVAAKPVVVDGKPLEAHDN